MNERERVLRAMSLTILACVLALACRPSVVRARDASMSARPAVVAGADPADGNGAETVAALAEDAPMGGGPSGSDASRDVPTAPDEAGARPVASVCVHVRDLGWDQGWVGQGETAGTTGRSLPIEAIRLSLEMPGGLEGSIECKVHAQDVGWGQGWVDFSGDSVCGSVGMARRVEAVRIRLGGALAESYDIWYRVHASNIGWMAWAKDGACAGTTGLGLAAEALQAIVLPAGDTPPEGMLPPSQDDKAFRDGAAVRLSAHVSGVGWQGYVPQGTTAGTTGQGLRVEALRARVAVDEVGGGIAYRAHVENVGWTDWVSDGAVAGTTGRALRVEAVEMALTGEMGERFDLYYRVHVKDIGWLAWASSGMTAGTTGMLLRVEGLQAMLVPKGDDPPTGGPNDHGLAGFSNTATISCDVLAQGGAWGQHAASNGGVAGTTGQARPLHALRVTVDGTTTGLPGGVTYRVHVSNLGWVGACADGADAPATATGETIEAIEMSLTGRLATFYDLWYRAHVGGAGWLGWAQNGSGAGSVGLSLGVEAIQALLAPKGSAPPGATSGALLMPSVYDRLGSASGAGAITGFGGYVPSATARHGLEDAIGRVGGAGYGAGFIMCDIATGRGVAYNPDAIFYAASTAKGPYVASLCAARPDLIAGEQGAIMRVLAYSSNEDYIMLRRRYGSACMDAWCVTAGVRTDIAVRNYPYYSARELARLWVATYDFLNTPTGSRMAGWYQSPEISPIRDAVGGRAVTRTKAGWIGESGYRATADAGIVYVSGKPYVVAIMTDAPVRFDLVRGLARALHDAHGEM